MEKNPLDGIRVLEYSEWLNGPLCSSLLAQFGAEVIKVEPLRGDMLRFLTSFRPEISSILSIINHNKKSITLDIKKEKGRKIFRDLSRKSDVIVENTPGGWMEKYGLDYESIKKINPGIIYASISGFGKTGPYRERVAMDDVAQATGGIMSAMKRVDRPPSVPFADYVSGLYAVIGILLALKWREISGKGQWIDVSMQDCMFHANIRGMGGMLPEELLEKLRKEFSMAEDLPAYGSFPARDGWIVISAFSEGEWRRLVECIGREELRDKKYSNFFTRMKHEKKIREIIREWTAGRTRKEIEDELIKWRIPCGPVLELGELPQNPQLLAREMFKELQHPKLGKIKVPGVVLKLSESSGEIFAPAPELGEHNEEVYSSILGYKKEEIEELRKERVI